MLRPLLGPEPMRSETFPYPDRFAAGASSLGTVCYFDAGEAREQPPVVLIHALGLNFTQWEYVAPALATRTRVIGLDLPGCGHSSKPKAPYSLALMSEAVLGVIDQLGLDKPVIFGHSFGGRVAMDLALHHRDKVRGLVLMNSAGFMRFSEPLQRLASLLLRPSVVAPALIASVNLVFKNIFAVSSPRTERFVGQVVGRYDPRCAWEFAHYACPLLPDLMTDVIDRLPTLDLPTLVLWGDQDELLRLSQIERHLHKLPNAKLLRLADCGHMPNLEQPEAVSAAVAEFLRGFPSLA